MAPLDWLGEGSAGDLFLACACAEGIPEALRQFHAAFIDNVEGYLRSLRPTPEIVDETRQLLLESLFVGTSGKRPTILQYQGRGALGGWVRVCAVRTALDLLEAQKTRAPRVDDAVEVARAIVPDGDPELELIRASCADEVSAALRAAMASLSRRDRSLLRLAFVDGIPPARIGAMYGVHRTTAMRWIGAVQEEVLARTRARMIEIGRLSPSECDRVFGWVKSRIDISLAPLLSSAPEQDPTRR
jgi:RNA polymerase sigma-70 factor (ECF subfamily)